MSLNSYCGRVTSSATFSKGVATKKFENHWSMTMQMRTSPLPCRPRVSKLWPAGKIWPTKPFHLACKNISSSHRDIMTWQWLQNCPWIFKFKTLFNMTVTHDDNAVGLVET